MTKTNTPDVGQRPHAPPASQASTPPAAVTRPGRRKTGLGRTDWCSGRTLTSPKLPAGDRAASPPCGDRTSSGAPAAAPGVPSRTTSAPVVPSWAARPVTQRRGRPRRDRAAARSPGIDGGRLDPHPGDLAVEQHRVVDDRLPVQGALLAGGQPLGGAGQHGPGLVADQRHPGGGQRRGAAPPATAAARGRPRCRAGRRAAARSAPPPGRRASRPRRRGASARTSSRPVTVSPRNGARHRAAGRTAAPRRARRSTVLLANDR